MGNPAHCVIEAEFLTKEEGPIRQNMQERVARWLMKPDPLARIRFFDTEESLVKAIALCYATEQARDTLLRGLQRQESSEVTDRPQARQSSKRLAKDLADLGDRARACSQLVRHTLDRTFRDVARENRDIAIRNEQTFIPLDRMGVLYVAQALHTAQASTLLVYRANTLYGLDVQPELSLF